MIDDDEDIFARVPAPKPAVPVTAPWPVALFACHCGGRDEVKEPAPLRVDCWSCKRPVGMFRWTPPHPPPARGGRPATEAETARAERERRSASKSE